MNDTNETTMTEGNHSLGAYKGQPLWFSNRKNPITEYIHRLPMRFSTTGELIPVTGTAYVESPRWVETQAFVVLEDGNALAAGIAYLPSVFGTWEGSQSIVASYNASGTPDSVIYHAPNVNGHPTFVRNIAIAKG